MLEDGNLAVTGAQGHPVPTMPPRVNVAIGAKEITVTPQDEAG